MIPVHIALNKITSLSKGLIRTIYAGEWERQNRRLADDLKWIVKNMDSVEAIIELPPDEWPNRKTFPKIIMLLAIHYHIPIKPDTAARLHLFKAKEICLLFELISDKDVALIERTIKEKHQTDCYVLVLKAIMVLGLKNFSEITFAHIEQLRIQMKGIIGRIEYILFARAEENHVPYLEFLDFAMTIYSFNIRMIMCLYRSVLRQYPKHEDFILSASQADILGKHSCFIFWARYHMRPLAGRQFPVLLGIHNAPQILQYFKMADSPFFEVAANKLKGSSKRIEGFYKFVVRAILYFGAKNVYDLAEINLRDSQMDKYQSNNESYEVILYKILQSITKKEIKYLRNLKMFGYNQKQQPQLTTPSDPLIEQFINVKYKDWTRNKAAVLLSLKIFEEWSRYKYNFFGIENIPDTVILEYKEYLKVQECSQRVKNLRYNVACMFLKWYKKGHPNSKLIIPKNYTREFVGLAVPRMFNNREHATKILREAFKYEPKDEYRYLAKQAIIIGFATGIRISEIIWLGPDCYVEGEIFVQVREKQNQVNKPASVYPYGIPVLQELIHRFGLRTKFQCFNEKKNQHFYILFEIEQRPLEHRYIYEVMRELITNAGLSDDLGNAVHYKNIKMHAARHQKLSDIYEISDCSLTATKMESGHRSIEMLEVYTQQQRNKMMREIAQALERGRITGKGARIVEAFYSSTISPNRFTEVLAKMNIAEHKSINSLMIKDLGFGFCIDSQCSAGICVSCDWYFACTENIPDLIKLYKNNQILLALSLEQSSINKDSSVNLEVLTLSLLYARKWLVDLGVNEDSLENLSAESGDENGCGIDT